MHGYGSNCLSGIRDEVRKSNGEAWIGWQSSGRHRRAVEWPGRMAMQRNGEHGFAKQRKSSGAECAKKIPAAMKRPEGSTGETVEF